MTYIPIVMRSYNDRVLIEQTLEMVLKQTIPFELYIFDNDSQDGTLEILPRYTSHIHRVPAGTYIPGRVLNEAMGIVDSSAPYVVFLNSDCTPVDEYWLERLIEGFSEDHIGAVFGQQVPRADCLPLFAKDTIDTFGDGSKQKYWKHCFSMASSAIRRSCWEMLPFRTDIQYSEDIDWTWRIRERGWTIQYVQESKVYHSHNYSLSQFRKRQRGEGTADAQIFSWSSWERSFLRYSLLPFVRNVKDDVLFGIKSKQIQPIVHSPFLRFMQMIGRREGFLAGLKKGVNRDEAL